MLSPVLCALTTSVFVILWGAYLSTLNHAILIYLLLLCSILAGAFVVLISLLETGWVLLLVAFLLLVSWLSHRLISDEAIMEISFVDKGISKERYLPGRGNRYTLIVVGLMLGASAVLAQKVDVSPQVVTLALGICTTTAGLLMRLFYRRLLPLLGDFFKRMLTLFMAIGLLLFGLVGHHAQLVCMGFLFVTGAINLLLVMDAISETSRFNQISPFYLIGKEGAILLSSVTFSTLLCSTGFFFTELQGSFIVSTAIVICCGVLQIGINNQTYPLFVDTENALPLQAVAPDAAFEGGDAQSTAQSDRAFWRERIEYITGKYHLSLRQREIMELLMKGRDSYYIMEHFCISRSTAKTHIYNLYRKIGIHSRQELLDLMERQE
jgi:DNA-binding CsgD family transcriptional regulator